MPAGPTIDGPNWLDRRLRRLQGPDRPWTILLEADLHDAVPRAEIEDAWRTVVRTRPELHVSLAPDAGWARPGSDPSVTVAAVGPELDRPRHGPGDPAISVIVDDDPASVLSLVVDHALTDGLGVRAVFEDLLRVLGDRPISPRRRVTDEALDTLRARRPAIAAAIGQIPPRRLASLGATGDTTHLASTTVDLATIHARRREPGVSVGAVVIAATLQAVGDAATSTGTVAVGVPADLRRHIGDPTGVGNAVVNLTVTDRRHDPTSIDEFLDRYTTRRHLGETLSWVKRASRPGPPATVPRQGRAVASAMLSNLGAVGDDPCWKQVKRLRFAPPAHQTVSIGVVGHGDELTLTVRSRLLTMRVTDDLAADIGRRLGSGDLGVGG